MRAAFVESAPADAAYFTENARGRWQADLYALAGRRLQSLGVMSIHGGGECTFSDSERFYSYRKEGKGVGRLMGVIAVKS